MKDRPVAEGAQSVQVPSPPYAGPVTLCGEIPGAKPGETYLITLAAVNASDHSEIVSTFAAGQPFTVGSTTPSANSSVRSGHSENGSTMVCANWGGLDDNYMPVVPGNYAVRGIASPASTWSVDGKPHAIIPECVQHDVDTFVLLLLLMMMMMSYTLLMPVQIPLVLWAAPKFC